MEVVVSTGDDALSSRVREFPTASVNPEVQTMSFTRPRYSNKLSGRGHSDVTGFDIITSETNICYQRIGEVTKSIRSPSGEMMEIPPSNKVFDKRSLHGRHTSNQSHESHRESAEGFLDSPA